MRVREQSWRVRRCMGRSYPRREEEDEENGERCSVRCQDNDLRDTTIEGFGGFVGAFLQLTVMTCLLDDVENLLCERGISDWPSFRAVSFCSSYKLPATYSSFRLHICWP